MKAGTCRDGLWLPPTLLGCQTGPACCYPRDVTSGMSPPSVPRSTHHHLPTNFTSFLLREGVPMWGWTGTNTVCSNLEVSWSLAA